MAVLGIGLIAMGEEVGCEMAFRAFGHLLRYGELPIRRSVPLALALIAVSNPKLNILDTLSKFSHDSDPEVAHNAILSMGIVGAGKYYFNNLIQLIYCLAQSLEGFPFCLTRFSKIR